MVRSLSYILLSILIGGSYLAMAQGSHQQNLKYLDSLLNQAAFQQAKIYANKEVAALIKSEQFLELADYAYYLGRISYKLEGKDQAIHAVNTLTKSFEASTDDLRSLRQLALETGSFYESIGDSETAKNCNLKAYAITKKMPDATGSDFALIESNIGVFASRLGDIPTAARYHNMALKSLQSDPKAEADSYYISYNSLGAMMWYTSKFDSAVYYFKKAEKTLKSLEQTPWNKYYRVASLNNNIAGVYNILGNIDSSMTAMQTTIKNLNSFLKEDISDARRTYAKEFLFQAIDNYGGLYKDIGDYKKARQLIAFAFDQKQNYFDSNSPEIAKSLILMGQIASDLRNYEEAKSYLNKGIEAFKNNSGDYTYWLADAYYLKGMLNYELDNLETAKSCFAQSETYYKASLGDYYDELYLDFVAKVSNFYANTGKGEKALSMAKDGLDYIRANQGTKTLLEYYQQLNLADISYKLEDFDASLAYISQAMDLLNSEDFSGNSQLNTLQIKSQGISAILLKVKTLIKTNPDPDVGLLEDLLHSIDDALALLEQKRSILSSDASTSILIQDNIELFNVAKHLNYELYKKTNEPVYLEKLLGYHESMVYYKIRTRLNSRSAYLSANLPEVILAKENKLKTILNQPLDETYNFNKFLEAEQAWNNFLEELKLNYPNYYKLRYASISQELSNISSRIPSGSTIIRYLHINSALFALVLDSDQIEIYEIPGDHISKQISMLNKKTEQLEDTFELQNKLYTSLWQPFEDSIRTHNVVIIPDKELFNLSFELLSSKIAKNLKDLKNESLLAKYSISYNYSLFLIDRDSQPIGYDANFVAFAPEFNEAMKSNYRIAIQDSVNIDYGYLRLLPQPFAKNLAKNYSRIFNGSSFLNEKASKQIFTQSAKEHKIIHIGTHAESDNVSPEFSRLIFAKQAEDDNNYLYTYEIYNQNLSSNLAILTACETGKPSFQPGEGMISLAHAFNYAGSESILTSLWKIDEKSSAEILDNFYKHIADGLPKDEALRQAKLEYLDNSEGRTLAPQYWAGLVLIGDQSPIALSTSYYWYWVIGILVLILTFFLFRRNMLKRS